MIFRNGIIFNEAKKQKSPKEEDIDIKELKNNIKSANTKMEKIISKKLPKDNPESGEDEEVIGNTERKLNRPSKDEFGKIEDIEGENFDNRQSIDDEIENDDKQSSNALDFEDDGDLDNIEYEIDQANEDEDDEIDYMGDENDDSEVSWDDFNEYEVDDLDDIDDRIDEEDNDENALDGEFDPDDDLENIEADIEDSNFSAEDFEEPQYEEEIPQDDLNQAPEQPELKERKAEVNPLIDSGDNGINLPTDGLDDDLSNIDSQIDGASQQGGGDPSLNDPNMDPSMDSTMDQSDPLYSDFGEDDPIKSPEDEEAERLKKIVLLKQYKELITVITDFKMTIEHLKDVPEFDNDENVAYILDQLQAMKDKIMFTVEHKFLDAKYTDLLKIYYYFKFGLNSTSKFMEKLINSKQNNKQ